MATDYDKGKVTQREKLAAQRQNALAEYNAKSVTDQLKNQLKNYDVANKQNAKLRDVQLAQNSRKAETDRFEAQRNLQNAALGLFGSMNQAMNGSTVGNVMSMLANRNDSENNVYWQQLADNQNAVRNAYNESYNQNQIAKRDAVNNAYKALRDIQADHSANLANINPNLYEKPGANKAINKLAKATKKKLNSKSLKQHNAKLSGYVMPPVAEQAVIGQRNTLQGNDYFSQLINGFNGR